MAYRMLVADLDGTILNTRDELAPATREALHAAHRAGCLVVPATGRTYRTARPVVRAIGLGGPAICGNGSIVIDSALDRTLHTTPLTLDVARRAARAIHGAGQSACVHVDGCSDSADFYLLAAPRIGAETARFVAAFEGRYGRITLDDGVDALSRCLSITVTASQEALEACREAVAADLSPGEARTLLIDAPNFGLRFFEVFAPNVNKWTAASQLARQHGIEPAEIIAAGDDVNDFEMISAAGLGIAMPNAPEAVRKAARRVAPPTDQNGLATVLRELFD